MRATVFAVLAIVLMILDQHTTTIVKVRSALMVPLTPIQYFVSGPINLIDNISQMLSSHDALVKENLDLKAEQLLLKAEVQRYMAIESENNQLKALLMSANDVKGKTLIAQLLAIDSEPFIHQVILDKGSRENVYIGQPVLDANGIMGQVIQVTPSTSRVLLINDPRSGVPVENMRNNLRAIAVGDGYTGQIHLVNVSQTADILQGDIFVTSGLGQNYPQGYPVGQVINVVHDQTNAFATIVLKPKARLEQSRQVLLLWPTKPPTSTITAEHKNA